jgi:hypothetical protein
MDVSGQLHAPAALPPGKEPLVPTELEAGWAPEPFWTRWWREKFSAPAGNRTLEPRSSNSLDRTHKSIWWNNITYSWRKEELYAAYFFQLSIMVVACKVASDTKKCQQETSNIRYFLRMYEGVSKSFRTESIKKSTTTTTTTRTNTRWEAMQKSYGGKTH